MLWPAFLNRGPFFNPDTRGYLRGADAAIHKLTGRGTVWPVAVSSSTPAQPHADAPRPLAQAGQKGILLGRSPFYGLLLAIGALDGRFWLTLYLQACAVLLALALTLRAFAIPVWPGLAWAGLALCLVPALPFYVCYLLPYLFAGIAILACAVLVSTRRRLPTPDLALWFLLLAASTLFHDSCTLIAAAFLLLAALRNLARPFRQNGARQNGARQNGAPPSLRNWSNWPGLAVILLSLVTAFAGQALVVHGATRVTGQPPVRLPFLSARLVADGPGARYLRAACPSSGFALCAYVQEFPLGDAEFLFGNQPGRSVFATASNARRRALSDEQFRFFLAVLRYDPAAVTGDALLATVLQLADFRLITFNYDPGMRSQMASRFPPSVVARIDASRAWRGAIPAASLSVLLYAEVLVPLAWTLVVLFRRRSDQAIPAELKSLFLWLLAGIVINAFVCGALSAIDPRYQARVIWLVPFAALLVRLRLPDTRLHADGLVSAPPFRTMSSWRNAATKALRVLLGNCPVAASFLGYSGSPTDVERRAGVERRAIAKWLFHEEKATSSNATNAT